MHVPEKEEREKVKASPISPKPSANPPHTGKIYT